MGTNILAAILAAGPTGDGVWATAFIGVLSGIGIGAWRLLADSSARVDRAGERVGEVDKEQRDRLHAELERTRADRDANHAEAMLWQERYYALLAAEHMPDEDGG